MRKFQIKNMLTRMYGLFHPTPMGSAHMLIRRWKTKENNGIHLMMVGHEVDGFPTVRLPLRVVPAGVGST